MIKNQAGQSISAVLIDKATATGLTTGTTIVYLTKDGGTQELGLGTIEHEGNGQWTYKPTQEETNAAEIAFLFVNAGALPVNLTVYTVSNLYTSPWPTQTPGAASERTWRDLISDAFVEIGAYATEDPISAAHMELGRRTLNRIIDGWAARKCFAYNVNFSLFTLTPNHQPHLIGPGLSSPDFSVARPVKIENAAIVLTGTGSNVDVPMRIRDDDWWASKRVKAITSSVPTDLYYSPDSPSGSLYLWPVPNYAYGIRLEMWISVGQIAAANLDDLFANPYGYEDALTLTLAERLCRPMARQMPATLPMDAKNARTVILSNNIKSSRIVSAGYGTGRRKSGGGSYADGWAR
jgi:hypothetical protein